MKKIDYIVGLWLGLWLAGAAFVSPLHAAAQGAGGIRAIQCHGAGVTALDVHACTALTALNCSGNPALTALDCSHTQLSALDLSTCTALSALNVSGCASLTALDCNHTQLSSLDLAGCTALSSLNVSDCAALTGLDCSHTALSSLDLAGCTALSSLDLAGCTALSSLDLAGCTALSSLDVNGCASLTALDCANKPLVSLNVNGCTALSALDCSHTQLTGLDLAGCNALSSLNVSDCAALTALDCANRPLSLLNVAGCTALSALDCSHTPLSELDLSASTALSALDCSHTQLSALDVSTCTALSALDCSGNRLSALNVSGNPGLAQLDCSYNRLQALDVSGNPALERLNCSGNGLTALNVGGCRALTDLWCHDNALTALNLNDGVNLETLMCWRNALTTLDISRNAKLKNLNAAQNGMLLSTLAKQLQLVEAYGIEHYAASPQTPSITLEAGEDYSLSREWTFNGMETDITVEDLDGNPLPGNWYVLDPDQMSIRFNKDGIYRIRLRNLALRGHEYEESTGQFTDERYIMECIITAGVGDLAPETAAFVWKAVAGEDKAFSFVCKGGLEVNWGDGTTDTYAGGESLAVTASHGYNRAGYYKVQLTAQSFMSGIVALHIVEAGMTAIDVQAAVSLTTLDAHGNTLKLSDLAALIPDLDQAGVKHVLTPQVWDTAMQTRKRLNIRAETMLNDVETDIIIYDADDEEIESGYRLDERELSFTKAGDYTVRLTNGSVCTYADLTALRQTPAEVAWRFTITASSSTPSNPDDPSRPSNPTNPSNPSNPTNPSNPSNPTKPTKPTDTTANEAVLSAAPFAYVQGRTVYLSDGLGEVEVFTAVGQRVYRGRGRAVTMPHAGVYVLRVVADGRRCKVLVR